MKTIPPRTSLLVAVIRKSFDERIRRARVQQRLLEMIVKHESQRGRAPHGSP